MRNQINITWFHKQYIERYGRLHPREATSHIMYARIVRLFFKFIKEKLYAGYTFNTPIGEFKIVKVLLTPNEDRISFAAIVKGEKKPEELERDEWLKQLSQSRIVHRDKNKNYFHTIRFTPANGLEGRYTFRALQMFLRNIHHHYD